MRKKFDSVRLQRKIRESLGKEYLKNRKIFLSKMRSVIPAAPKVVGQH